MLATEVMSMDQVIRLSGCMMTLLVACGIGAAHHCTHQRYL